MSQSISYPYGYGGRGIPNIKVYYSFIVVFALMGALSFSIPKVYPDLKVLVDSFGFLTTMMGFLFLMYTMYVYGYEEGFRHGETESKKVHPHGYKKV